MKNIFILLILGLVAFPVLGQVQKVKGSLTTVDTADLTILKIYPDSFPNVSVLFKAETRRGEPVWNLAKEKMQVKENSDNCSVVLLEQVSKNKPINLSIVIDHSGSMSIDNSLFDKDGFPLFTYDDEYNIIFPKGYSAPIDNAKKAVKKFVSSFNSEKDFISITGFSSTVDPGLPLTQDINKINTLVESLNADSSTALYDAMLAGIDEIHKSDGIKVLVVLTDGHDNSSKSKWNKVIDEATKEEIPIYIIGLGDVNKDTLSIIANSTKGHFYYTKSSSSLDTVYASISKQVQAFYNLVYTSTNLSSADSSRQLELSFDIDNTYLVTEPAKLNLPQEVIAHIKEKEQQEEYLLFSGLAAIALLASGGILFYYRKRKNNRPTIKNLFPNPSDGLLNIEFNSSAGVLRIVNMNGQTAKSINLTGDETTFDFSDLTDGNYIAVIESKSQRSNAVNFIIRH